MNPLQVIGDLRERVMLRQATYTDDGFGGQVEEWHDVAEVWARVEPVKSNEQFLAGGVQSVNDVLVHIRHRDDVTQLWRLIWRDRHFSITGLRNLDERRRFLTIDATSW